MKRQYAVKLERTLAAALDDNKRNYLLNWLKEHDVRHMIFFLQRSFAEDALRQKSLDAFKASYDFFGRHGIELIPNICTIGFGETTERTFSPEIWGPAAGFSRLVDFYGRTNNDAFCPLDGAFVDSVTSYLRSIARTGARMMMIDDDLCMNIRPGLGCACDGHMALYQKKIGESITREQLQDKIYVGGENPYRTAWIDLMGDTMRDFCRTMREAVDQVDPTVRLGQMASYTNWDLEGADCLELAKILAGNTRPFMRLSGAPYWVSAFQRFGSIGMGLSSVIEFLRVQEAWCEGEEIDLFDENDNFPRPRYHTSASATENVDLCLTASGGINGLVHFFNSSDEVTDDPGYKTVYEQEFERNLPVKQWMWDSFSGECAGLRVYEAMNKAKKIRFPDAFPGQQPVMDTAFSPAQSMLSRQAIPVQLKGRADVSVAFGPNPYYMPEEAMSGHLILDAEGALAAQNMGIDVGILSHRPAPVPTRETFSFGRENLTYYSKGRYYEFELAPSCEVLSEFWNEKKHFPAAYRYENASGQKVLVFSFDGYGIRQDSDVFVSYNRQRQILDTVKWMGGSLPASCPGHPGLYLIARRDGKKRSVALCNISQDWVRRPVVELDCEPASCSMPVGSAQIEGNRVMLSEDIPPYGFVCFTAE